MRAIIIMIISLMMTTPAFATYVHTQYSGSGDLSMETSVYPSSIDSAEFHGEYSGSSYSDESCYVGSTIVDGYGVLSRSDNGVNGDHNVMTQRSTGMSGNGTAYLLVYSNGTGYSGYGQGTGDKSWTSFYQTASNSEGKIARTLYGGYSNGGTVEMISDSRADGWPYTYNSMIYAYGDLSGSFVYGEAANCLVLNTSSETESIWLSEVHLSGGGLVELDTISENETYFGFEMVLG